MPAAPTWPSVFYRRKASIGNWCALLWFSLCPKTAKKDQEGMRQAIGFIKEINFLYPQSLPSLKGHLVGPAGQNPRWKAIKRCIVAYPFWKIHGQIYRKAQEFKYFKFLMKNFIPGTKDSLKKHSEPILKSDR